MGSYRFGKLLPSLPSGPAHCHVIPMYVLGHRYVYPLMSIHCRCQSRAITARVSRGLRCLYCPVGPSSGSGVDEASAWHPVRTHAYNAELTQLM